MHGIKRHMPGVVILLAFHTTFLALFAVPSALGQSLGVISFQTNSMGGIYPAALTPSQADNSTTATVSSPAVPRTRAAATPTGPRYNKPYNICTSAWTPFVNCSADVDPASWNGYQIDLLRIIAADMGWSESDWFMSCVDWTPMLDDLIDPNGGCYMAAAGG